MLLREGALRCVRSLKLTTTTIPYVNPDAMVHVLLTLNEPLLQRRRCTWSPWSVPHHNDMGTPHIGMGRDMSIFQIGESPYQYGAHSNLGTDIDTTFETYVMVKYEI